MFASISAWRQVCVVRRSPYSRTTSERFEARVIDAPRRLTCGSVPLVTWVGSSPAVPFSACP